MPIDRDNSIPLYLQLKQDILEKIQTKEYPIGSRLPSEDEFTKSLNLSRFTIRQAFQALEKDGWLKRVHGKGTYVSEPKVPLSVAWQLLGFMEDMTRKGHRVQSRIIESKHVPAPYEIANYFKIPAETNVAYITRVRTLNDLPFLVDKIYVRLDLCPDIDSIDLTDASLFETFDKIYGLQVEKTRRSLTIASSEPWIAEFLEIDSSVPLFLMTDHSFVGNNQIIEIGYAYIRGDRSVFVFDLVRADHATKDSNVVTFRDTLFPLPLDDKK